MIEIHVNKSTNSAIKMCLERVEGDKSKFVHLDANKIEELFKADSLQFAFGKIKPKTELVLISGCSKDFPFRRLFSTVSYPENVLSLFCHERGERPFIAKINAVFTTPFTPGIELSMPIKIGAVKVIDSVKKPKSNPKTSIHFIDPARDSNGLFIPMMCGISSGKHGANQYTTNIAEVTCTKCRNRIEDPIQAIRRFGRIQTFGDLGAFVDSNGLFDIRMMVVKEESGFKLNYIAKRNNVGSLHIQSDTIEEAFVQIRDVYENKLIPLVKHAV